MTKKSSRDLYKDLFEDKLSPEEKINLVIDNLDQLVCKQNIPFSALKIPIIKPSKDKSKDD